MYYEILEFGETLYEYSKELFGSEKTEKMGLEPVNGDINKAERNIYNGARNLPPETYIGCTPPIQEDEFRAFAKELYACLGKSTYAEVGIYMTDINYNLAQEMFEYAYATEEIRGFSEYEEFGNLVGHDIRPAWTQFMDNNNAHYGQNVLLQPEWWKHIPELTTTYDKEEFITEFASELESLPSDMEDLDDYNPEKTEKAIKRVFDILEKEDPDLAEGIKDKYMENVAEAELEM